MNSILRIKPLGPARLAALPIADMNVFGIQKVLGVPLPSTILGILGVVNSIVLNEGDVEKDSLLGIGILTELLSKNAPPLKTIIEGPIINTAFSITNPCLTIPILTKEGTVLVKIENEVIKTISNELIVPRSALVGKAIQRLEIGVALRDSLEGNWNKVVAPGYTFRRGFIHYVRMNGKAMEFEFIYKLNIHHNVINTLVRLGGEGRQARLVITDKVPNVLLKYLNYITSPLEANSGLYIVLNYWPLIPTSPNTLYLERDKVIGLEFFEDPSEDIIGIPQIVRRNKEYRRPRKEVIRIGLGFSEVLKRRRPQILALPPGTLVYIRYTFDELRDELPSTYIKLLMAGYSSLFKLKT